MKVFLSETSRNKFNLQSIESLRHGFIVSEIRSNKLEHIPGVSNRIISIYTSALGFGRRKEKPVSTLLVICH